MMSDIASPNFAGEDEIVVVDGGGSWRLDRNLTFDKREGIIGKKWKGKMKIGGLILFFILSLIALSVTAFVVPGVRVENFTTTLVAALVICIINLFLKPILQALSMPITILTLGLFYFVVNGLLMMLAAWIVPGLQIDGFWWAVLAGLVYSIVMTFFTSFLGGNDDAS